MTRAKLDFSAIKAATTIVKVATEMLTLELKKDTAGYRCPCPSGDDPRAIKITPGFRNKDGSLGAFYCHHCTDGGDLIKLYSHCTGVSNYDAAADIAKHYGIGTAPHTAPSAAPTRAASEGRGEALKPLDYLDSNHQAIGILGLSPAACETIGIGFAGKGTMSGRIVFPLRLPDGRLVGYFGVACRADMVPLFKVPTNLDEMVGAPDHGGEVDDVGSDQSPEDLRKLFRVVG